ncbi:hypothetical protein BpHYR1_016673 [Brachionus plicatilis]|uniref:Uncharacterized protein n=1 Tax=Brachionus plicatilis TaxID=10195 RepID=A0A3M7QNB1_BRAPC|nr:hypothetical protein BpHYR1_016673 [Brachionus plicatilis]
MIIFLEQIFYKFYSLSLSLKTKKIEKRQKQFEKVISGATCLKFEQFRKERTNRKHASYDDTKLKILYKIKNDIKLKIYTIKKYLDQKIIFISSKNINKKNY